MRPSDLAYGAMGGLIAWFLVMLVFFFFGTIPTAVQAGAMFMALFGLFSMGALGPRGNRWE